MIPEGGAASANLTTAQGAVRQGGSLLAGRLIGAVLGAAWLVLAARAVGPSGFGTVAVLIGIGTILGVVAELGVPLLVAEAVSGDRSTAWDVVRGALRLRIPAASTAALVLAVTGLVIGGGRGALAGALYGVSLVGSATQTTLGAALRGLGRAGADGAGELAVRAITLVCGLVAMQVEATAVSVMLAYAVGAIGGLGLLWAMWARSLPGTGNSWTVHPARAAGLGSAAALVTLYNRIDVLMLAWIGSKQDAGIYAAGYRFFEGLLLPPAAIGAVLVPAAVAAGVGGVGKVIRRFAGGAMVLTALGSLVIFVFARHILVALLGEQYAEATSALRLLAIAAIPSAAFTAVSPIASLGHRSAGVPYLVVGCVANASLNLILIQRLGAAGCGWAMIVSQTLMAGLFIGLALRYRGPGQPAP